MDLKLKVRTYNFWVSLASAVLVVLHLVGEFFGFKIDSGAFMDIVTAVCGVLVVLGIIIMPTSSKSPKTVSKTQNKEETQVDIVAKDAVKMQNDMLLRLQDAQNVAFCENEEVEVCADECQNEETQIATKEELMAQNFVQPEISDPKQDAEQVQVLELGADQAEISDRDEINRFLDEFEKDVEAKTDNSKDLLLSCIGLLSKDPEQFSKLAQSILDQADELYREIKDEDK